MKKNNLSSTQENGQRKIDNFFRISKDPPAKTFTSPPLESFGTKARESDNNQQMKLQSNKPQQETVDHGLGKTGEDSMMLENVRETLNDGYDSSKTIELVDEDEFKCTGKDNPKISSNHRSTSLDEYFGGGQRQATFRQNSIYTDKQLTLALPHHIPRIWREAKPMLEKVASKQIQTIDDTLELLNDLIQLHYNNKIRSVNVRILLLLLETFNTKEVDFFFDEFLPNMANLALRVEYLFKDEPTKILSQNCENFFNVTLTKEQVACLLSNMFFCTMHRQNNRDLPYDCSLSSLYKDGRESQRKLEKLQCLYNYFKRVIRPLPNEYITYQRLVLDLKVHGNLDDSFWGSSKETLSKVIVEDAGAIEDRKQAIQVDFANKYLGGGVLDSGCVQEEIRFTVSPELLVAMLFTERLLDHEAVIVIGAEQYSKYTGYSSTFKFAGDFHDPVDVDLFNRKDVTVLAVDATDFSRTSNKSSQYRVSQILRELNKAYIGFYGSDQETGVRKEIATGRWGCGAFLGDPQLKFILQWMATSKTNRTLLFYRFKDQKLKDMEKVIRRIKDFTIAELFEQIKLYNQLIFHDKVEMALFDYLLDVV